MKPVQEIQVNLQQPEQQKKSRGSLDRELLAKLWLVMSGMFGERWTKPYGEWDEKNPAIGVWGAGLRGVTQEQFTRGLEKLSDSGAVFVPSTPEFKRLCVGERDHPEHIRIRQADQQRLALPKPEIHREVGKSAIQTIKNNLRKGL